MIRVGTTVRPQHGDFAQMRETWLRAEDMGADTLFVWYVLIGSTVGETSSSGRSGAPHCVKLRALQ